MAIILYGNIACCMFVHGMLFIVINLHDPSAKNVFLFIMERLNFGKHIFVIARLHYLSCMGSIYLQKSLTNNIILYFTVMLKHAPCLLTFLFWVIPAIPETFLTPKKSCWLLPSPAEGFKWTPTKSPHAIYLCRCIHIYTSPIKLIPLCVGAIYILSDSKGLRFWLYHPLLSAGLFAQSIIYRALIPKRMLNLRADQLHGLISS